MDQWSARRQRVSHGHHRWKRFKLHFDCASCRLGLLVSVGGHRGDLLAMKTDDTRSEKRMIGDAYAVHARRIFGKGDGADARHLPGAAGVDFEDTRRRDL